MEAFNDWRQSGRRYESLRADVLFFHPSRVSYSTRVVLMYPRLPSVGTQPSHASSGAFVCVPACTRLSLSGRVSSYTCWMPCDEYCSKCEDIGTQARGYFSVYKMLLTEPPTVRLAIRRLHTIHGRRSRINIRGALHGEDDHHLRFRDLHTNGYLIDGEREYSRYEVVGSKEWIWMPKTIDVISGREMLALLQSKGQQRSDIL